MCEIFGLSGLGASVRADYVETILADNPLAYYRFVEEPGATEIVDSSENGHDSQDGFNAELGVEGAYGNAVDFIGDGSILLDCAMDRTDPEDDGTGTGHDDFSIEFFVNLNTNDAPQVFVARSLRDRYTCLGETRPRGRRLPRLLIHE